MNFSIWLLLSDALADIFFSKAQSELKNVNCKSLNELTVKFYVTLWVLLTCQHFTAQRKAVLLASYKGNRFKWMDVTDKLCHSWKKEKEMLAKMKKKTTSDITLLWGLTLFLLKFVDFNLQNLWNSFYKISSWFPDSLVNLSDF